MASPITCHVLNTLSGTPAAGLSATLTLLSSSKSALATSTTSFAAVTNEDGRVKEWEAAADKTLANVIDDYAAGERIAWSIKFAIGPWYEKQGVECFWPEIEVKFYVKKGERHYHVPVLVGPWTYTTYRGS
jgi:5-hydroxyisourate hydrolase